VGVIIKENKIGHTLMSVKAFHYTILSISMYLKISVKKKSSIRKCEAKREEQSKNVLPPQIIHKYRHKSLN